MCPKEHNIIPPGKIASTGMAMALFPKTRRKLLTLFFLHPESHFYYREVVRLIGDTPGSVLRELRSLTQAGILRMEPIGIQKFYKANRESPIFPELVGIVQKTFGIVDILADLLKDHEDKIKLALIHGSIATGTNSAESDIDLLIVADLSFRQLSVILNPAEKTFNREINPTLYSPGQFASEYNANNHFIRSVLRSKVIYLIGSENDIEVLAKPTLDQ